MILLLRLRLKKQTGEFMYQIEVEIPKDYPNVCAHFSGCFFGWWNRSRSAIVSHEMIPIQHRVVCSWCELCWPQNQNGSCWWSRTRQFVQVGAKVHLVTLWWLWLWLCFGSSFDWLCVFYLLSVIQIFFFPRTVPWPLHFNLSFKTKRGPKASIQYITNFCVDLGKESCYFSWDLNWFSYKVDR